MAQKLCAKHVIAGRQIRTLAHFRKYVFSHEGPVMVLFKNGQNDHQSDQVERRLKRALIRTRGQFKLCLIDAEHIDEELTNAFKIHYTPSIFLFYKANVA
jgi:thioredoxin-like negative regulator of GroEL